jgi:hypothetical protein
MTTEFKKKIFDIQSEIGKISKDSTNPFYKSKYFDINKLIEQLHPLLVKNKVILLQPIRDNKVYSEIIDLDSDSTISSYIELTGIKDPQKVGIEVTYFRRYTLTSLLGLQAEDEDGNVGQKPKQEQKKPLLSDERFEKALLAIKAGTSKKEDLDRFELTAGQKAKLS